jgi:hypothetical protein
MPELINANPTIYTPSKASRRVLTVEDEDENIEDIIDSQEVFGMFFQTDFYFIITLLNMYFELQT